MALTNDDLQAIAQLIQPLKDDMQDMKDDMQGMKDDMQNMKNDIHVLSNRTSNIELSLENKTNRSIQLLAENHINLVDKLNATIRAQDKSILCEVQISGLKYRMEALEKEVSELRSKIA